jgi:malto-oligosyltrehalose trehalohydrolase
VSELIDPRAYRWRDDGWRGKPWITAVIYELHVGTFTAEGTFLRIVDRLDYLAALGVTAIELMPIAAFPGARNWGYDGVFPYACSAAYGYPNDLKRLVDEAHARGIMVLLDVVYNHFGPEGNYLSLYAPQFFTERHRTPWGAAINFDGAESEPVREFYFQNAMRWVNEFHLDGLRLDAVHTIMDEGERHFLDELAARVHHAAPERHVHLILENEENQASRLARRSGGTPVRYTAQWNDDVHHVLHAAATQESCGYYADYHGDTDKLGRALAEGFAFQGELMHFRGSPRGETSWFLPPEAFVAFIQNHDQIGNRARGERLGELASHEARRAIAAVYLLLPQIPMLFMGEEWNASRPFPFFCDYQGDLGEAVRAGRCAEFAHLPEFQGSNRHTIPDPLSASTFESAILRWEEPDKQGHHEWLAWYRHILAVRRTTILPVLKCLTGGEGCYLTRGPQAVTVQWLSVQGGLLRLNANLSDSVCGGFPADEGREVWIEGPRGDQGVLQPWSVQWFLIRD